MALILRKSDRYFLSCFVNNLIRVVLIILIILNMTVELCDVMKLSRRGSAILNKKQRGREEQPR